MSTYKNLMTVCCAAVLVLGLAACGGGGGDDTADAPTTTDPTPPAPPPPADLTTNFAAAQDANDDAMDAGELATGAMESATENDDMLTTMEVAGDSSAAMAAAEAILKAQTDAGQAVMDAEQALEDANAAMTAAEALDDDHPQKTSLVAAIEAAIKAAEQAIEDTTAIRDGDAIKDAVAEVTGGEDADPQGTPRSIATSVGMDIAAALQATSPTDGGGLRHTHGTTPPAAEIADALKVEMNDRVGMTWKEITGATMKMRIATSGTDTDEVYVSSIAGMSLVSSQTATDRSTDMDAVEDDGLQTGATYKGIPGTAICAGDDCVVETVDDPDNPGTPLAGTVKFTGTWYFTPTSPMQDYVKDGMMYTEETMFATFGHWLVFADQGNTDPADDTWTLNTFATSAITDKGDWTTVNATGDSLTDTEATYSGSAVGMSVRKMPNAAGDGQDIDSGRFTAEVDLTAEFGATAMLKGMIHSFQGSAVGDWTVTLVRRAIGTGFTDGVASASGRDGVWVADSYGPATGARPTGIFGGFNAHFLDGHAAGAYSTRKNDD